MIDDGGEEFDRKMTILSLFKSYEKLLEQERRMKEMGFSERHFTKSKMYGPLIK